MKNQNNYETPRDKTALVGETLGGQKNNDQAPEAQGDRWQGQKGETVPDSIEKSDFGAEGENFSKLPHQSGQ